MPPESDDSEIIQMIQLCRGNEELFRGLAEVYESVDSQIASREWVCLGGGCCCKFDLAGHRLYVSSGELAYLLQHAPPLPQQCSKNRCPYQVGTKCLARYQRPLGCRTYFCSAPANELSEIYEAAHNRIKQLHINLSLPYFYSSLTATLLECSKIDFDTQNRA